MTTGIEEGRSLPVVLSALAASPNPFTGSTAIRCAVPLAPRSEFRLYDAAGSLVRVLPAGSSRVLSGDGLRPGVYLLRAGDQSTRLVKAAR